MKKGKERKNLLGGVILPAIGIVCIAISIAIAFPFQSQGGVILEEVAMADKDDGKKKIEHIVTFKPTTFRAEIVALNVGLEDGVYVGQAWLQTFATDTKDAGAIVAVIPAPRVQRVFELAMTRTLDIWVWGYIMSTPEDPRWPGMPFYKIVGAEVSDPDVTIKAAVIVPEG